LPYGHRQKSLGRRGRIELRDRYSQMMLPWSKLFQSRRLSTVSFRGCVRSVGLACDSRRCVEEEGEKVANHSKPDKRESYALGRRPATLSRGFMTILSQATPALKHPKNFCSTLKNGPRPFLLFRCSELLSPSLPTEKAKRHKSRFPFALRTLFLTYLVRELGTATRLRRNAVELVGMPL
jgi:hypothetical protein